MFEAIKIKNQELTEYLTAACFADGPEDWQFPSEFDAPENLIFHPDSVAQARKDLDRFKELASTSGLSLLDGWPADFWYSRQGHGTGFFDRQGYSEGDREMLQDLAGSFGELTFYTQNEESPFITIQ